MKIMKTLVPILLLLLTVGVEASDWPRFRGADGAGVSLDKNLPSSIDRNQNLVWSAKPPTGNSSPIIVNGRLYLTGHLADQRMIVCLDSKTGKELWRKGIAKMRDESFHPRNGSTTPSPTTDGSNVFVFFPEIGLVGFDRDGKELWRTPLGPFTSIQGLASSPVYAQNKVLLLIDTPEQASLSAYNSTNGKEVWKAERQTGTLGSYTTPTVSNNVVIVAGAVELTGYDLATGKRVWWVRGVSQYPAAPPFVVGDSVYSVEPAGLTWPSYDEPLRLFDKNKDRKIEFSEMDADQVAWSRSLKGIDRNVGNRDNVLTEEEYKQASWDENSGGLARTKLGGSGNVGQSQVLWRNTKGMPFLTGALLYKNVLYAIEDGILSTFDPETGKRLRQEKLTEAPGDYYASPIAGDDKIYLVSLKGKVTVLKGDPTWTILSTGDLGEEVIATPAIADEKIYIRTVNALYCFGNKKE
jgi:outer membrane protein assembly factor BamB